MKWSFSDWWADIFDVYQPLVMAIFSLIMALLIFHHSMVDALIADSKDAKWWVDVVKDLVVLPLITAALVGAAQARHERNQRKPYENWTVQLIGIEGVNGRKQKIHWTEARKFEESDFEYWKFIKSCVSNTCLIKTIDAISAQDTGWLKDSDNDIIIDFAAMGDDDIIKWYVTELPATWEWLTPPRDEKVAQRRKPPTP